MKLSILDFVPVRSDQTSAEAIRASVALAQVADQLGYERYWVAEHHNAPTASTAPGVALGLLAARTTRIRVGSGGVMLPNHTALAVAEQFAFLEAAFPGRIDLGLGRAPGGEPVATLLLRGGGVEDPARRYPQEIESIKALLRPEGARFQVQDHSLTVKATPAAESVPMVWVLGSSPFSARLAAETGMPYVYAHHFYGFQGTTGAPGIDEAAEVYRTRFRPSPYADKPVLIITMNAVVAETEEEARRLTLPYLHDLLNLRAGRLTPQVMVEEAEAHRIPVGQEHAAAEIASPWVIGTGAQARACIKAFARRYDVDEVMIHPVTGAFAGAPADRNPQRETTLRLLAEQ
ncbi:LLM class flavin-dependent oxidoreductase [Streptomyces sp. NPDC090499]|uniref:LLM class flavin-dependent oxidoreductase n=1 Tax=Streptomyces sp. NPDC090499 TaxID=3365965 RepID=UPI0037F95797